MLVSNFDRNTQYEILEKNVTIPKEELDVDGSNSSAEEIEEGVPQLQA